MPPTAGRHAVLSGGTQRCVQPEKKDERSRERKKFDVKRGTEKDRRGHLGISASLPWPPHSSQGIEGGQSQANTDGSYRRRVFFSHGTAVFGIVFSGTTLLLCCFSPHHICCLLHKLPQPPRRSRAHKEHFAMPRTAVCKLLLGYRTRPTPGSQRPRSVSCGPTGGCTSQPFIPTKKSDFHPADPSPSHLSLLFFGGEEMKVCVWVDDAAGNWRHPDTRVHERGCSVPEGGQGLQTAVVGRPGKHTRRGASIA